MTGCTRMVIHRMIQEIGDRDEIRNDISAETLRGKRIASAKAIFGLDRVD